MARHRRSITRDDLLHRYATARGLTYGEAHDIHAESDIEELRSIVETYEADVRPTYVPRRRSFARSQPTTSLHGQTR